MKFIIPQTKELTREVIKEEFFKKYYPEMKVREGWWYIYGRYVMLQKNPFVCAKFTVKQKDDEGKTHIRIKKDQNMWAYIIAAPIISHFIHGDFYDELYRNFSDWLTKKYALSRDEKILTEPLARTKFFVNVFLIAAIIVGILLLIFDQISNYVSYNYLTSDNYTSLHGFLYNLPTGRRERDLPYILLMFCVFSGVIYYFMKRRKDESNEKMERILGLKMQAYKSKNKFLKPILSVIKWICLYFVLFIMVALVPNLINNMTQRDFEGQLTETYITKHYAGSDENGDYKQIIKTFHKPTNKVWNDVSVLQEYNGYALCELLDTDKNTFIICNPQGEVTHIEKDANTIDIGFWTPDIIYVNNYDGKNEYYGLDGKPVSNLAIWAFEYRNSVGLFAIIAAVLFAVILYFWRKRKRKGDEKNTSVSPNETARYERIEEGDTTLKL